MTDLAPVDVTVDLALPPGDDTVLVAVCCDRRCYTVVTFLTGSEIYVGSIIFASERTDKAGIVPLDIGRVSFQRVVPDLRAMVDLVRAWHEHA